RRLGRWRFGTRQVIVAGQTAISLVLAISAGLFARSLDRLASTPAGFDADHVLMATIKPSLNRYTPASALALYHALQARLAAAPGVRAVGTTQVPVLAGERHGNITTLYVRGHKQDPFSLLLHTVS